MPTLSDLIVDAPAGERSLLELRATWRSLPDAHARVAARLRVFVLAIFNAAYDQAKCLAGTGGRAPIALGTRATR